MPETIALERIKPNPGQPRKQFDPERLQELADSIKEVGLLNPILVRSIGTGFEIVHGERRWRACQLAGMQEIPAEVRELDDETAFLIALSENLQRDNLNPMEEAQALYALKDKFNYSQAEIGSKIGKSQPWISGRLALLKLPAPVQEKVITRVISPSAARELSRIESPELQASLAKKAADGNLTIRELEAVKSTDGRDWPPPVLCPNRGRFFDVLEWARDRTVYLDNNPRAGDRAGDPSKHNKYRRIIELELARAAGGLLNKLEQEYGKKTYNWILKNAGKVVLVGEYVIRTAKGDVTKEKALIESFDIDGLIDKYPWAEEVLRTLGWIDNFQDLWKLAEIEIFGLVEDIADLFYILLWSHGWPVLYPDDPPPEGETEGYKTAWEKAQITFMETEYKELIWANLVLDKWETRGLEVTPIGIDGKPDNLTLDEYAEILRAFGLYGKYGDDAEMRRACEGVNAPEDLAILA